MAGDSVSLRILMIAAVLPDHQLWQQAAAKASVPIELEVLEVAPAATLLARVRVDVCLLDADLSDAQKNILIKAARAAQSVPLIFIVGPKNSVRPAGVDGVLAKPVDQDEAHKQVQLCVRAKIPTRVLIVDDSSTMRSIVRKILQGSHFAFDIQDAAEGNAALELLRNGKFGIVFLDYNMPGLNGLDTLVEIKRANPAVAVVMMTSTINNDVSERALAAGAFAFFKKPFYPADIDATLERYYGLSVTHAFV
jgi:CheY-like chemotaxis protein